MSVLPGTGSYKTQNTASSNAELNKNLRHLNDTLCCINSNIGNNTDRELFMACDEATGEPVIVTYAFDSEGNLTISYTNLDGTPFVGTVVRCPDQDYELINFQWFCFEGTDQISRSDLYLNGIFQSFIWQDMEGTVIAAPTPGSYTLGDCRGEFFFIPGYRAATNQVSNNFGVLNNGDGTIDVSWDITNIDPTLDSVIDAYIINYDNTKHSANSFTSGTYTFTIHPTALPNGHYEFKMIIETVAGFRVIDSYWIHIDDAEDTGGYSYNNSNWLSAGSGGTSYYVLKNQIYAAYDKYGVFVTYTQTPNITDTTTLAAGEFFSPDYLPFNNKDCFEETNQNLDFLKTFDRVEHYLISNGNYIVAANTAHSVSYSIIEGSVTVDIDPLLPVVLPMGVSATVEATGLIPQAIEFTAGTTSDKVYITIRTA